MFAPFLVLPVRRKAPLGPGAVCSRTERPTDPKERKHRQRGTTPLPQTFMRDLPFSLRPDRVKGVLYADCRGRQAQIAALPDQRCGSLDRAGRTVAKPPPEPTTRQACMAVA